VDRRYLEERLAAGASLEQIGGELGLHASTIGYWLKKHDLVAVGATRFAARGAPDRSVLERLAADGATLRQMAEAVDRLISTVRHWLRKWNIERPRRRRRGDPALDPMVVERECRRHGLTRFGLEGRGYYRCLLCRQERVSEWRRRVKRKLISEAGGRCMLCGYAACAAALQFTMSIPLRRRLRFRTTGSRGISNWLGQRQPSASCYVPIVMLRLRWARKLPAALTINF
jgi:transposase